MRYLQSGYQRDYGWEAISHDIEGEFIDGGAFQSDRIDVTYGNWTITIDLIDRGSALNAPTYTRLRAQFISQDAFWFKVYRNGSYGAGLFQRGKKIQIGDPVFNQEFTNWSNDASRLTAFMDNQDLRRLTEGHRSIELNKSKPKIGDLDINFRLFNRLWTALRRSDTRQLTLLDYGAVSDPREMTGLVELFKVALDQLDKTLVGVERQLT